MKKCNQCGTESIKVVYYVGEDSTHCGPCWLKIVQAIPDFNIEAIKHDLDKRFGTSVDDYNKAAIERALPTLEAETLQSIPLNQLPLVMATVNPLSVLAALTTSEDPE